MKAKIYKPAKNAMQSGKANIKYWILKYLPEDTRSIDPIMGWTSNTDTKRQLTLKFKTLEEAEKYAKDHKINYIVTLPKTPKLIKQAYAENFTGSGF